MPAPACFGEQVQTFNRSLVSSPAFRTRNVCADIHARSQPIDKVRVRGHAVHGAKGAPNTGQSLLAKLQPC